jgi:hypothetical protein
VRRHIHVQDTTHRVFHEYKDVEEPKGCRHHHTEVTGDDRLSMVADKGPPALGRDAVVPTTVEVFGHILAHGTGRHAQAKLQEQFVGNPLLTPRWVVTGHPADERSLLRRDWGPSTGGFPPPEPPEPLAVLADERRRLDHGQGLPPSEPVGEPK